MSEEVVIVKIGAEGGSIKVLKRTSAGGAVEYSVQLRDQTLTILTGEESDGEIRHDSTWSENWTDAVRTLGRWPWPMLHPVYIDPEYRELVLSEVRAFKGRDGQPARPDAIERWGQAAN